MRVPALAATDLDLGRSLRWCHNRGEKGMSWTRICMENSWARVAAIVLMLGLIMPESLRAGVVLEDGEIDSSTVEVGTFAVVIYGQGERQPVSGERESLTTARGYIQAVDAETLTLALEGDHGAKQIALNRIQTLVLIGLHSANKEQPSFPTWANRNNMQDDGEIEATSVIAPAPRPAVGDTTQVDPGRAIRRLKKTPDSLSTKMGITDNRATGRRIAKKLGAGGFVGIVSGFTLAVVMSAGVNDNSFGEFTAAIYGWWTGYMVGTSVGVTLVDPHDRSVMSATGSLGGTWVGIKAAIRSRQEWIAFVCPIVFATIMSELWRDPPEDSHFSIGLAPGPMGHLFAVATLRF